MMWPFLTPTVANWQAIDPTTMTFPSEMRIDYVRVYQREDHENVGCDPPDYPTMKYINDHPAAYSSSSCSAMRYKFIRADGVSSLDPQLQYWNSGAAGANYAVPKSSLVRLRIYLHVSFLTWDLNEQLNGCQ